MMGLRTALLALVVLCCTPALLHAATLSYNRMDASIAYDIAEASSQARVLVIGDKLVEDGTLHEAGWVSQLKGAYKDSVELFSLGSDLANAEAASSALTTLLDSSRGSAAFKNVELVILAFGSNEAHAAHKGSKEAWAAPKALEQHLAAMVKALQAKHIKSLILVQPPPVSSLKQALPYSQAVTDVARQFQVPYVDTLEAIAALPSWETEAFDSHDWLSPQGHNHIFHRVSTEIKRQLPAVSPQAMLQRASASAAAAAAVGADADSSSSSEPQKRQTRIAVASGARGGRARPMALVEQPKKQAAAPAAAAPAAAAPAAAAPAAAPAATPTTTPAAAAGSKQQPGSSSSSGNAAAAAPVKGKLAGKWDFLTDALMDQLDGVPPSAASQNAAQGSNTAVTMGPWHSKVPEPNADADTASSAWMARVPEPTAGSSVSLMRATDRQATLPTPPAAAGAAAEEPVVKKAPTATAADTWGSKVPEPTYAAPAWMSKVPEPAKASQAALMVLPEPHLPPTLSKPSLAAAQQPAAAAAPWYSKVAEPTDAAPAWMAKVAEPQPAKYAAIMAAREQAVAEPQPAAAAPVKAAEKLPAAAAVPKAAEPAAPKAAAAVPQPAKQAAAAAPVAAPLPAAAKAAAPVTAPVAAPVAAAPVAAPAQTWQDKVPEPTDAAPVWMSKVPEPKPAKYAAAMKGREPAEPSEVPAAPAKAADTWGSKVPEPTDAAPVWMSKVAEPQAAKYAAAMKGREPEASVTTPLKSEVPAAPARAADTWGSKVPEPTDAAPVWMSKVAEPQAAKYAAAMKGREPEASVTTPLKSEVPAAPARAADTWGSKVPEPTDAAPVWMSKVPEPQAAKYAAAMKGREPAEASVTTPLKSEVPAAPAKAADTWGSKVPEPTDAAPAWMTKVAEPQPSQGKAADKPATADMPKPAADKPAAAAAPKPTVAEPKPAADKPAAAAAPKPTVAEPKPAADKPAAAAGPKPVAAEPKPAADKPAAAAEPKPAAAAAPKDATPDAAKNATKPVSGQEADSETPAGDVLQLPKVLQDWQAKLNGTTAPSAKATEQPLSLRPPPRKPAAAGSKGADKKQQGGRSSSSFLDSFKPTWWSQIFSGEVPEEDAAEPQQQKKGAADGDDDDDDSDSDNRAEEPVMKSFKVVQPFVGQPPQQGQQQDRSGSRRGTGATQSRRRGGPRYAYTRRDPEDRGHSEAEPGLSAHADRGMPVDAPIVKGTFGGERLEQREQRHAAAPELPDAEKPAAVVPPRKRAEPVDAAKPIQQQRQQQQPEGTFGKPVMEAPPQTLPVVTPKPLQQQQQQQPLGTFGQSDDEAPPQGLPIVAPKPLQQADKPAGKHSMPLQQHLGTFGSAPAHQKDPDSTFGATPGTFGGAPAAELPTATAPVGTRNPVAADKPAVKPAPQPAPTAADSGSVIGPDGALPVIPGALKQQATAPTQPKGAAAGEGVPTFGGATSDAAPRDVPKQADPTQTPPPKSAAAAPGATFGGSGSSDSAAPGKEAVAPPPRKDRAPMEAIVTPMKPAPAPEADKEEEEEEQEAQKGAATELPKPVDDTPAKSQEPSKSQADEIRPGPTAAEVVKSHDKEEYSEDKEEDEPYKPHKEEEEEPSKYESKSPSDKEYEEKKYEEPSGDDGYYEPEGKHSKHRGHGGHKGHKGKPGKGPKGRKEPHGSHGHSGHAHRGHRKGGYQQPEEDYAEPAAVASTGAGAGAHAAAPAAAHMQALSSGGAAAAPAAAAGEMDQAADAQPKNMDAAVGSAEEDASKPLIVTLGDYVMRQGSFGTGVVTGSDNAPGWVSRLAAAYGGKAQVINKGQATATSASGVTMVQELLKDHPDAASRVKLVVLSFGGNDAISRSGEHKTKVGIEEYRANIKGIISSLRQAGVNDILIVTPPPAARRTDRRFKTIKDYAKAASDVARAQNVPTVDLFAAVASLQNWQAAAMKEDGLRLSERGQQLLFKRVMKALSSKLQSVSPAQLS